MSGRPVSKAASRARLPARGAAAGTVGSARGRSPDKGSLIGDIRRLVLEARTTAAMAVNASLTLLYWRVGGRIRQDVLGGAKRAAYGQEILVTLSRELVAELARYLTGLPPRSVLERRLHEAIARSQARLEQGGGTP